MRCCMAIEICAEDCLLELAKECVSCVSRTAFSPGPFVLDHCYSRTMYYALRMAHQGYARNAGAGFSLKYYPVFCPKYRQSVLLGPVAERLQTLLAAQAQERKSPCILWKPCRITCIWLRRCKSDVTQMLPRPKPRLTGSTGRLWGTTTDH
jgi:hypothetical protein